MMHASNLGMQDKELISVVPEPKTVINAAPKAD